MGGIGGGICQANLGREADDIAESSDSRICDTAIGDGGADHVGAVAERGFQASDESGAVVFSHCGSDQCDLGGIRGAAQAVATRPDIASNQQSIFREETLKKIEL